MKGEYRNADSAIEIHSILDEKITEDCLIWQNLFGERVVYQIFQIKKDEDTKEIRIKIINYNNDFDLNQSIYVKLSYRETMFKAQIVEILKDVVVLKFPVGEDVKTVELRGEPRVAFDMSDDRYVSVGVLHDGQLQKEQELLFQVVDISESGLCIIVSDQNKNYLQSSLVLAMSKIGDIELDFPIVLDQKYSTPYRYRKDGRSHFAIRVGFELGEKLDRKTLNQFISKK